MNVSSNVTGDSNDKINFPSKLSLNNNYVSRFCKTFVNNSLANIKLSNTKLSKIVQSGDFMPLLSVLAPDIITPYKN